MSAIAYRIKVCRGIESGQCPNLIQPETALKQLLEEVIQASGWPECLAGTLHREIKPLDQFAISASGCPNGCSRPQIADFGLLQAQHPDISEDKCTGCGECARACREGAIAIGNNGIAGIDSQYCLFCGTCIRNCPEQALFPQYQGYRIQVGGKLGRHPRLAEELPAIQTQRQMLQILDCCLHMHQEYYRPGLRFGQIVETYGTRQIITGYLSRPSHT